MQITVEEAYKSMVAGAPVSKGILAADHSEWSPETPIFNSWAGCDEPGIPLANRVPDASVEIPEGHKWGYCAQWIYLRDGNGVFVNLPGMQSGEMPSDGTFPVGTERIYSDTPAEELERFIEAGYHKLMELVAQEKPKGE